MGLMDLFKNRRDRIIDDYLSEMVISGVSEKTLTNLHFPAAIRYAQDNGGVLYPDMRDSIIFDKIIHGRNYSVFFLERNGNVHVQLTQQASSADRMAEHVDQVVAQVKASMKKQRQEPDSEMVIAIRDRAIESLQAGKRLALKAIDIDDVEEFYAFYGTVIPVKKAIIPDVGRVRISVVDLPDTGPIVVYAVVAKNEVVINAMQFIPESVEANDELLSGAQDYINEMLDEALVQMQASPE